MDGLSKESVSLGAYVRVKNPNWNGVALLQLKYIYIYINWALIVNWVGSDIIPLHHN